MDLTPGSTVCDSRSLSAEAAEYEAQASVAETELRQLDARMKALKEKAEQARLAKQQTEAAREQAFQEERQDRQAAVQESINGHVLEGLRRKIADEVDSDLLMGMLERLAAGRTAEENEVTWFHTLFMEELTGNDQEFLRDLASRLLRGPEPVAASEKQGPRSQGLSTAPKYHDLATKSSGSTTPAKNLAQSPLRHLLISPKSSYNRNESPELGTGENAAFSGLFDGDIPESLVPEGGGVAETNFAKGEEIIENIRATDEQDAKEEIVFETDNEERDVAGNVDIVPNTITQDVVDLSSDDVAPVPKYDFTMDDQAADTNAGSNEPEQAGDYIAGVEYNTIEQEDVANASNLERSFEAFEWANTLAPVNRRQSTASTDSAFAAPQIPQSATTTLKRAVAGAQKATPVSEKPSSKRKRRELEGTDSTAASVSTVSIIVRTPANKKAKATDASESTETPSKKGKGNAKEDVSMPARVQTFINNTKKLSLEEQAKAIICVSCERLPETSPRLSNCNHMYCAICWKSSAKTAAGKKPSEMPCELDGCEGHLGRAVIVPADLDILNLQSEVWTGGKAKGAPPTQQAQAAGVEKEAEATEADEQNDTIDVE